MNEYFLHFVWQYQYFDKTQLQTDKGETISVLHPGYYNTDQGPDFSQARILIDRMEWHGHVEIHVKTSDWYHHKHQTDKNYDTVVLHVVWKNDCIIQRQDKTCIPVLELGPRVDTQLVDKYRTFMNSGVQLPCQYYLQNIDPVYLVNAFEKALTERLERKAKEVLHRYQRCNNHWEEVFWQLLVSSFGFKINNEAFEQLSKAVPYRTLLKHGHNTLQQEAILFGQAGFLENIPHEDIHAQNLKEEYEFLSYKYSLDGKRMQGHVWKFLRTRPCNFPTVRIAQLAALVSSQKPLINILYDLKTVEEFVFYLKVPISDYWQKHYKFGERSNGDIPGITTNLIHSIILNVVIPIRMARYVEGLQEGFPTEVYDLLTSIPSEVNKITKEWERAGVKMKTAYDSQAAIELYNQYCLKRKCLYCSIGNSIIKR